MKESALTDVQVSLETGSGLERRLRVQVPAGRIEEEVELRLRDAGRTARLKGFRPGKAPAHVVRQHFGPQIRQEVLQELLHSSYSEAIEREKLRPAGSPRIESAAAETGQDFSYTAVFEVYPEFSVAGLDDLVLEKPEPQLAEADIDQTVGRLRHQKGTWRPVERGAVEGDRIVVDFEGTHLGEPVEGGKAERFAIVLGEGRMLADFERNLIGMTAGSRRNFLVRFPGDYHEEELRDAEVSFDVLAHEVAALELPELDAGFVRSFGIESGDPGEFRRLVRENLEREAAAKVQADMRRQAMEHLLASNPVELPSVLVAREAAGLQARSMRSLGLRDPKDAPPPQAYEEVARRRVRLGLVMGALVREHDIKLDPSRVEARLEELCRDYEQPAEVRKIYLQNPELMAQVENAVMEEQVVSWLLERARVVPKKVAFAELMAA
jgi:trigger factor